MKDKNLNQTQTNTNDPSSSDCGETSLGSYDGIRQNQNQNEGVIFDAIAPHPQPVVIGDLLTEIEDIIKRHVVLPDAAATALAVWVLHTYVYEVRDTVAYVAIESPEKRCGKTTLLTVLGAMANKPLIASNVTVGALFRAIDTCRPTLLIDEADTFLAGNTTMRGVINSGNTWRTAYVLRMSRSNRFASGSAAENGTVPLVHSLTTRRQAMAWQAVAALLIPVAVLLALLIPV